MTDDHVPAGPTGTGAQRAPGERRRRRSAERTGQVDLDSTMSHWAVVEPPTVPRPVVLPARPTVEGVATAPVLPTPEAVVVGPLLEARGAAARAQGRAPGSRRSRRAELDSGARPAAATVLPGGGSPGDVPAGPAPHSGPAPQTGRAPQTGPATPRAGSTAGPVPSPRSARPVAGTPQGRSSGLLGRLGRRGWLLLAAAAVLVVVLVLALVLLLGRREDPAQAVVPVTGAPAQQTLALTLADPVAGAGLVGGVVVGVDAATVATLLLPAELLLTVADAGEVSLEEAAVLGAQPVRRGLEDTLLLRVDGVLPLQPAQLASLVDAVGGVVVDVTTAVVTDQVALPVGDDQRLAGAQAVAYAALAQDGEPTEARLARLGAVVQALLTALPADADATEQVLGDAALTGAAGLDAAGLTDVLHEAGRRAADGGTTSVMLPTRELAAGGAALRGVDDDAARAELDSRFAGALLPVAAVGEVRVLVRNAVGTPGLAGAARDLLVADGLRFAGGGNAAEFGGMPATVVLVASQGEQDIDEGGAVARALGLDESALQVNAEALVDTDVVVVLGDDFARTVAEQTAQTTQTDPTTPETGTTPGTTPPGEAP